MAKKDGYRNDNRQLTDKQKELLPFLSDDKSDNYISVALEIGRTTVQRRIDSMIDILKLADRDELVKYAKEYLAKEKEA